MITNVPDDKRLPALESEFAATVAFEPGAEKEMDLNLPDTATAFVTFIDESGATVTEGIRVRAIMVESASASHKSSETLDANPDGSFSWDGFYPGVECSFVAKPAGGDYASARSQSFHVEPNAEPVKLVVQLYRNAKLTGRLLGPDGSVLRSQSFWCNLSLADGTEYGPVSGDTNWNGYFTLEQNEYKSPSAIPAAAFTISIYWADESRNTWKWESTELDATSGDTLDIGEIQIDDLAAASN